MEISKKEIIKKNNVLNVTIILMSIYLLILTFWISLIFELTQFILALGACDITDLINNTIGGIIGISIYFMLTKIFKSKLILNKIINIFSSFSTICFVLLLTILFMYN